MIKYESIRFHKKGKWVFLGILIRFMFFQVIPESIKKLYVFLPHHDPLLMIGVGNLLCTHLSYYANISVLVFLYYMKIPFFEQFKVTSSPWPWEENYEKFKELTKKTALNLMLNYGVLFPIVSLAGAKLGLNSILGRG